MTRVYGSTPTRVKRRIFSMPIETESRPDIPGRGPTDVDWTGVIQQVAQLWGKDPDQKPPECTTSRCRWQQSVNSLLLAVES